MLAKRLIPCLDVDRGRVVKGVRFVSLRDAGDPVEAAVRYDACGADELVFLDITASSDARPIVIEMVRRVAEVVYLPFTVGGGVRSVDDAELLLRAGADKVAVNTAAVHEPALLEELARRFGSQAVVLAIDARAKGSGRWPGSSRAWRRPAALSNGGPTRRRSSSSPVSSERRARASDARLGPSGPSRGRRSYASSSGTPASGSSGSSGRSAS